MHLCELIFCMKNVHIPDSKFSTTQVVVGYSKMNDEDTISPNKRGRYESSEAVQRHFEKVHKACKQYVL